MSPDSRLVLVYRSFSQSLVLLREQHICCLGEKKLLGACKFQMKVRSPTRTFSLMGVSWSHLVLYLRVCWLFMAEERNGCVDVLELFLCALFPISQLYLAPAFLQPIKNIKKLPFLRSCMHILQTIQFKQKCVR